jgi:hypothetical protein
VRERVLAAFKRSDAVRQLKGGMRERWQLHGVEEISPRGRGTPDPA